MPALDEMTPSVELLRALTGLDPAGFGPDDLDRLSAGIVGWERIISYATASQNELLAAADRILTDADMHPDDTVGWYPDHLGLMITLSGGSVAHRMNQATHLVHQLPKVHAALKNGSITHRHAEATARVTRVLDREVARAVDAAVMERDDWRTPSQLEKSLERVILDVDPDGAAARHAQRRKERDVRTRNEPDGMVSLWALLPAEHGQAVAKKIEAHARSCSATREPGDDRTLAQRRADGFVDLILRDDASGASPTLHGRRPQIRVTVALSTLLGADQAPAHLEGYGWITADLAARIAADPNSVWRRLIVDPADGRLLDYGRTTYRPPQDLADHVIARDLTCTFPTCAAGPCAANSVATAAPHVEAGSRQHA